MANKIIITECPRDAMQGWKHFIPTDTKIAYLNQLLKVGFDVLDFGSFVSPKAIPQLADTHEVIKQLDLSNTNTKLLAIVANIRGASEALQYDTIDYLGFPFSISETFQQRNTNKSITESLAQVAEMQEMVTAKNKELLLYISMGFGNPYGDEYNATLAIKWFTELNAMGIKNIALADTIGVSNPQNIDYIFSQLIPEFPDVHIGAHFHSTPNTRIEKLQAAYDAGCLRFDSAVKGIGGCPMAADELVGNMATEELILWADAQKINHSINIDELNKATQMAINIFV